MKGIILPTKTPLEIINKKINDYMIANIPDYNATQWGMILTHKTENKFVLIINDDNRNPLDRLSPTEKIERKEIDPSEWKMIDN